MDIEYVDFGIGDFHSVNLRLQYSPKIFFIAFIYGRVRGVDGRIVLFRIKTLSSYTSISQYHYSFMKFNDFKCFIGEIVNMTEQIGRPMPCKFNVFTVWQLSSFFDIGLRKSGWTCPRCMNLKIPRGTNVPQLSISKR